MRLFAILRLYRSTPDCVRLFPFVPKNVPKNVPKPPLVSANKLGKLAPIGLLDKGSRVLPDEVHVSLGRSECSVADGLLDQRDGLPSASHEVTRLCLRPSSVRDVVQVMLAECSWNAGQSRADVSVSARPERAKVSVFGA
jgi:hypothetical protein